MKTFLNFKDVRNTFFQFGIFNIFLVLTSSECRLGCRVTFHSEKKDFISLFQPYNNAEDKPVIKVKLTSIKRIFQRRYLLRPLGKNITITDTFISHASPRQKVKGGIISSYFISLCSVSGPSFYFLLELWPAHDFSAFSKTGDSHLLE